MAKITKSINNENRIIPKEIDTVMITHLNLPESQIIQDITDAVKGDGEGGDGSGSTLNITVVGINESKLNNALKNYMLSTDIQKLINNKEDKVDGEGLIKKSLIADIEAHINDGSIHLTKQEKDKIVDVVNSTKITNQANGYKTITLNGVTSVYDANNKLVSTTVGGVQTNYRSDGSIINTSVNGADIKKNDDGSINVGGTSIKTDTLGNISINNNPIGTQTSVTTNSDGTTTVVKNDGTLTTIIKKDSNGNITSKNVQIDGTDLSDLVSPNDEWATNDDIDDLMNGINW